MSGDEAVRRRGYVYFMTNPAMPGHVKIGSTRVHPDERTRQLSSGTAVARPFKATAFEWFSKIACNLHAERELHAKYRQYRVPNREFFEIDVTTEQAQAAFAELRHLLAVGKPLDQALSPAPATTKNVSPSSARGDTNASVLGLPYWTEFNRMRDAPKLFP